MIDTRLWSSTPFRNRNAFMDLTGQIELFHKALAQRIPRTYPLSPIGSGRGSDWMNGLQDQCAAAATALGVAQPPDLQSYNLDDEGDFASWCFQVGQYHRLLAVAAGLF